MDQSVSTYFLIAVGLSMGLSVGGVALVGVLLIRLPTDYFCDRAQHGLRLDRYPILRRQASIVKNLLGIMLVMIGVVLSLPFVPGPGILMMLFGAMLLDFRDKRRWERWLVTRPPLWWAINSLRRGCGKRDLDWPT